MGIPYGYQLYARRPITRPEVRIDGWWLSGIVPWGDLKTATRQTGDWQASWSIIRPPTKKTLRHPAFRSGAPVEVKIGPVVVWVGALTEPDWDAGEMTALGAPREAEGAAPLTAGGEVTSKPNTAVDQGIVRGALGWTRGDDFTNTEIVSSDGTAQFNSVARLLDAWAADDDNPTGWRVGRDRVLRIAADTETDPAWFITPGSGELGVADDERVDRVFLRFSDSTDSGNFHTASWPATTPVGGTEKLAAITNLGQITPTKAQNLAKGIWRKMQGRSGWTNGLNVNRSQVTTEGGIAADLGLIKAGDAMRLLGVPDPRGLAHNLDVVIGDTDYDWAAGTIQLNPVGLAARTFEAVLEDLAPGATAFV
jgi:hypothetical protein